MAEPFIVIGAGIGGLSAAIRLRLAGKRVTIFEKNNRIGGKMYQIERDGFRWDTGPSVITMRHVLEDLFQAAGRQLEDYLTLLPLEPLTRYFYPDGSQIDASSNLSKMAAEIAHIDERDVSGYLRYLAYAAQIHQVTGSVFIYDKPPTPASFTRVPVRDWLKADPFRTMQQAIEHHVRSPQLRQLLGRFATYVGGSPYEAPATLNVIAHVELTGGVWYPQGGVYQIAKALGRLAQELDIDICTGQAVKQINVNDGRVTGITLDGGQIVRASTVIANSDVTTTYNRLMPADTINPKQLRRLTEYEPSCSGYVMLLGIEGKHDKLAHHNIFFSPDYDAEFDMIFKQRRPSPDPTIYVSITSKSDPDHAPEGHENWFVLINAPALTDDYDWELHKQGYRDRILERLTEFGIDVRDRIVAETILTPADLERMSGAWRGALYGPSANKRFTAFLRPHNRSREVRGLYFAGGTTHPGGGVPMVTLSGKVAAEMVLEDER